MLFEACKTNSMFIAVAAITASLAASGQVAQAATAPNVTYTASGRFSRTLVSGSDIYKLAGEPFSLSVVANESIVPHSHAAGYATYTGLKATGTVVSALIPQSRVPLGSTHTFMDLQLGNPSHDVIELIIPVTVIKQNVTITAKISMPHGTITKWTINPFNSTVTLSVSNATVTYADGTNSTTLSIASGTLTAKAVSSSGITIAGLRPGSPSRLSVPGDLFAVMPRRAPWFA
jgi:hypothetical protein